MADEKKLQEALKVITTIAKNGASREQADIVAREKFGVTLQDVIKYDTDQRGVEVWGVPVPRAVGAGIIGYGQGLTSNFGDELKGRIKQAGAYLTGDDPQAAYEKELSEARALEESLRTTDPAAYYGGQVAGGVNQAVLVPGGASTRATSLGGSMARGAGAGAVQGAFAGAGAADSEDWMDRGMSALFGAGAGAAAGGVMPLVSKGAGALYDKAKGVFQDFIQPPINLAPAVSEGADAVTQAVQSRAPIAARPSEREAALALLAKNLERDQISPDQLQQAMTAMGPRGRLADLGPNLRDAGDAIVNQPGVGKAIGTTALENRQLGQQAALASSAKSKLGAVGDWYQASEDLIAKQAQEASPLYEKAFAEAAPVDTSDVVGAVQSRIASAKGNIKTSLTKILGFLGDEVKTPGGKVFQPDTSLKGLHEAKLAIDDMLDAANKDSSMGRVVKREIMQVKEALLDAIDQANPTYKAARDKFAGNAAAMDALKAGREFLKEDAEVTAGEIAKMTTGEKTAFIEGVYRTVQEIIESNPADRSVVNKIRGTGTQKKLAAAFPSKQAFDEFVQTVENEARFASTRASTLGNSATAKRLSAMGDTNSNLSGVVTDMATGNAQGLTARAMGGIADFFTKDAVPSEGARGILADILYRQGPDAIEGLLPVLEAARRSQAARAGASSTSRYVAGQQAGGMGGILTGER